MERINIAEAKTRLSELVERVGKGQWVYIARRGKPVARLTGVETPRKRVDLSALRALTGSMPDQTERAGDFMRRMRDDSRY